MAPRQIIVPGAFPSRDANGRVLPGKLRFYQPNTATPATVYTDSLLDTPHPWPILSDTAGRWPQIWADEATYFDVGWSDQVNDNPIATFEDIRGFDGAILSSIAFVDGAVAEAQASADAAAQAASDAQAALTATQAFVAEFGDISGAVAAAQAAATTASDAADAAAASAAAAQAAAASIDPVGIAATARATAIRMAASL